MPNRETFCNKRLYTVNSLFFRIHTRAYYVQCMKIIVWLILNEQVADMSLHARALSIDRRAVYTIYGKKRSPFSRTGNWKLNI